MRHDETRARSEARAEAFDEAAKWCDATGHGTAARYFGAKAQAVRLSAACAQTTPVRYTETPEQTRASTGPWSASEGTPRSMEITDCIEDDGMVTVHVTRYEGGRPDVGIGWIPGRGVVKETVRVPAAELAAELGWPDSYPFEALDPWPDNPAEACK